MPDFTEHYDRIDTALQGLLERGDINLTHAEQEEVSEFLSHREYGLALETLAAILLEHGTEVTHHSASIIEDAAAAMGMTAEPVVRELLMTRRRSAATG